jgi:hypothetical protein
VTPTFIVEADGEASLADPGTATATCPDTSTLTGGGVTVADQTLLDDITSVESAPDGANGWTGDVETVSVTGLDFTVYAICLPLTPAP